LTATVTEPSALTQTAGGVNITFSMAEVESTSNNALQLAVYGKLVSSTFTSYDAVGYSSVVADAAWHNAYKSASGAIVWDNVSGLTDGTNAYGTKGSSTNVNYKVYAIHAVADSTYQGSAELKAGFTGYAKDMTFDVATNTKYWCSNADSAIVDGVTGTAVPTATQKVQISLPANWGGTDTIVGYIAIFADGENITETATVGVTAMKIDGTALEAESSGS